MVRSTASAWNIGLAVAALALPLWPLPVLADDKPAEKPEARPQPLEPKAVRVILLPPASESVYAPRTPELGEGAPVVLVRPAGNAAAAQPDPDPVEADTASIMAQSAGSAAIARQRLEPAKIEVDAALTEEPSPPPKQRPRVATMPPVGDAAIASPRPAPAKTEKATPVAIPALPGRSPFRLAPFQSEVVETAATFPEQAPAKSSSPFRFLTNLWPGNKQQASTPVSPAGDGKAGSAAAVEQDPAEAGSNSSKPKRFLDVIQFWKN